MKKTAKVMTTIDGRRIAMCCNEMRKIDLAMSDPIQFCPYCGASITTK